MKIVLAGLPLKLRARITGGLTQADLVSLNKADELFQFLDSEKAMALVLHENLVEGSILDFLARVRSTFPGLILLVVNQPHSTVELKTLVRTDQVHQLFHEPAPADEIIKALALELGLTLKLTRAQNSDVSLAKVWHESLPAFRNWLTRLEKALDPQAQDLDEARRAAHYLAGNLGTFGFPKGTLLAREAEQLLKLALEGSNFRIQRLEKVVEALRALTEDKGPALRLNNKAIVVWDDEEFLEKLDMEARLLQWEIEVCDDLCELPMKLAQPQARVIVLDSEAAACKRNPETLDEILQDPYPTVLVAPAGAAPNSSPYCRWLERPVTAYEIMIAVVRSQLAPSLDNPPCILVVDDDRVSLRVIEHALSQVDFHVEALLSPLEFWDRLESSQPDLVILDVELPNMNGIELCRAMRLDDRYCCIPVVFLSSYADSKTVLKAFEAGADDYLYKPVVPDELCTRVSNRLARCQQRNSVRGAAAPSGRTYTSLDQLMLRALREDVPLGISVARVEGSDKAWSLAVQRLRANLRGEDFVKPLANQEIMVAMLSADSRGLERRIANSMGADCRFGVAWFPEDGREVDALLELARERSQLEPVKTETFH